VHTAQLHALEKQRRQHHHEQRPQVVHQVGLDGGRVAQRDEEQKVKTEEAVHAEGQRGGRDAPLPPVPEHKGQGQRAAGQQRDTGQQKGRHMFERHPERGKQGPEGDGTECVKIGWHAASIKAAARRIVAQRRFAGARQGFQNPRMCACSPTDVPTSGNQLHLAGACRTPPGHGPGFQ
jgi:hypothetical protein